MPQSLRRRKSGDHCEQSQAAAGQLPVLHGVLRAPAHVIDRGATLTVGGPSWRSCPFCRRCRCWAVTRGRLTRCSACRWEHVLRNQVFTFAAVPGLHKASKSFSFTAVWCPPCTLRQWQAALTSVHLPMASAGACARAYDKGYLLARHVETFICTHSLGNCYVTVATPSHHLFRTSAR